MRERFWIWLAWHLPRPLVYWSAIRHMAHATQGRWSTEVAPELPAVDALERWESIKV